MMLNYTCLNFFCCYIKKRKTFLHANDKRELVEDFRMLLFFVLT